MQLESEHVEDILEYLIGATSKGSETSESALRRIDGRLREEAARRPPYALVMGAAATHAEAAPLPFAHAHESELDAYPTRVVLEPPYAIFRGLPLEPRQLETPRSQVVSSFSATYPSEGRLELGAAVGRLGDVQHPTEPIAFPSPFPVGIRREEARLVGAISLPLPAGLGRLASLRNEFRVTVEATMVAPVGAGPGTGDLTLGTDSYRFMARGADPDGVGLATATLSLRVRWGGAEAVDVRNVVRFADPPWGAQFVRSGPQHLRVRLRGRENVLGIEVAAQVNAQLARSADAFAGLDFRAQPTDLEGVSTLSHFVSESPVGPFFVENVPAPDGAFVLSRLAIGIEPVPPRVVEG